MVATQEARTGEKRAARPAKSSNLTPAAKKLKTTACTILDAAPTPTPPPASHSLPAAPSPTTGPVERRGSRLPLRVVDNKPLPTLPAPQAVTLSNDEYRGLAVSAVLAASLERSRTAWTCYGIFQRYWTKPESGKNAKPPPPDNPDVKWMKVKGECRIRLEPHVFTADVYVEERPKAVLPKQYSAYAQQYRPQPGSHPGTPLPVLAHQPPPPRLASSPAISHSQDKKASPDPVISMLASRASSNPELRALMKAVAAGNASPEQLRVFQEHIDELTEIIKKRKKDEEEQAARHDRDSTAQTPPTAPPTVQQQSIPPPKPYHTPQQLSQQLYQPPQPSWTQAPTTHPPLILAFKDPGASEDRFLFPQMSILEPLSHQHELVSFIAVKKGREAADPTGLEPDQEYWQPVTMMVEVAYGREEVLACIRKWVKPADEVRKHMQSIIQNSRRAPPTHLAFRLPHKSAQTDNEEFSKEATPIVEEKTKPRPTVKYIKKLATSGSNTPVSTSSKKAGDVASASNPKAIATPTPAPTEPNDMAKDDATKSGAGADSESRPRRTLRKSVRIEG